MNIKIVKNRYLNALFLLMLFSAAAHMIILVFRSLAEKSIYPLNFFHILTLDVLFPEMFGNNLLINIASVLFMISCYLILLALQKTDKGS